MLRVVVYTGEEKKLVCNLKVTTSPVRNLISTSRVVHFGDIGCIGDAALWPRTCIVHILQWAKTFDDSIENLEVGQRSAVFKSIFNQAGSADEVLIQTAKTAARFNFQSIFIAPSYKFMVLM